MRHDLSLLLGRERGLGGGGDVGLNCRYRIDSRKGGRILVSDDDAQSCDEHGVGIGGNKIGADEQLRVKDCIRHGLQHARLDGDLLERSLEHLQSLDKTGEACDWVVLGSRSLAPVMGEYSAQQRDDLREGVLTAHHTPTSMQLTLLGLLKAHTGAHSGSSCAGMSTPKVQPLVDTSRLPT
jgi:hypothetical protein